MLRTVSRVRNLPREREIAEVLARHGFGFVLRKYALGRFLLGFRGVPRDERLPVHWGDELRAILEELGPTYIKMGQVLSLRPDIFPAEVLFALRGLRDQVRPVPFAEIREVIEADLEAGVDELFDQLDPEPIGSASIGQVYVARHGGRKVAVKVQRPGSADKVEADLRVMADIADVVRRRTPDLFFDPVRLVEEVAGFLRSELDYLEEARNTERIRDDFREDDRVIVPEVHWDRTTSRVLTTEFIEGTPLSRLDPAAFSLEDRRRLATLGAELSMTQVFEHGAFHGDAHPSNILVVSPERYGLIDFGLVGYVSEREMRVLTDYLIHLIRQQSDRLVRDLRQLGVTIPREHEEDVGVAFDSLIRRYYG
ncbi:MAG TPA: AarF/UbiB family protein, partial [Candidatus Dormibacteraeota bacterium]|nr:AarF/UbiB family protein [Candidatus Dormibacteraeota bacterium]